MRTYIERAQDFVKQIFPYLQQANFECSRTGRYVALFNAERHRKVKFRHGIARFALISSDYVVKYEYDSYEVGCVGGGEREIEVYAIAQREGFAYLLAEITRFIYCGHTFYIMPKIEGVGSMYGYADEHMTNEECAWCNRHHITDLHCNNYGRRKGHICIVDYACTMEETYSSEYDEDSQDQES